MKKRVKKEKVKTNKTSKYNIFKVDGKFDFWALLQNLIIPLAGAFIVNLFIKNSSSLYGTLNKPFFAPPAIVFPIVWTILYILMGLAAYRIFMKNKLGAKDNDSYFTYLLQLLLNYFWSIVFFRFKLYGVSFILAVILLIMVIITTIKFFKVDKVAGFLMIPYILWLSFASVLAYYVWYLNEMKL